MAKTDNLAILITDIVGYTELTANQTRSEQMQMMSRHNRVLRPMIARFQGRLIKSFGDGVLASFRSPTNALRCAMAIQDGFANLNLSATDSEKILVRIGVNVGEVRVEKNDVFGEAVNLAARIEGLAEGGEVYFTEAVYLAMNKAEIAAEKVGSFELKGMPEKVNVFRVPPHVTHRLIPLGELDSAESTMPFGGMHLLSDEYADRGLATKMVALWAKRPSFSALLVRIPDRYRHIVVGVSVLSLFLIATSLTLMLIPTAQRTPMDAVVSGSSADDITGKLITAKPIEKSETEQQDPVAAQLEAERRAAKFIQLAEEQLSKDQRKEAAASYGDAFALHPALAEEKQHAQGLVSCLSWGASVATPIIRKYHTEAMLNALIARTTQPGKVGAGRALALLEESGNADLVDWQTITLNQLKNARSCEAKAAAANKLAEIGDQSAIPALKKLRGSKLSFMFKWKCGRSEANEAITAIEARSTQPK